MDVYITFGHSHKHEIGGKLFDKDCVARIPHHPDDYGRDIAFKLFGQQWSHAHNKEQITPDLHLFPRGIITVPTTDGADIMARLKVKVDIFTADENADSWDDASALMDFTQWIDAKTRQIPLPHRDSAEIAITADGFGGDNYPLVEIWYFRPETDEEMHTRMDQRSRAQKLADAMERAADLDAIKELKMKHGIK